MKEFIPAVEAALKLAEERCAANPECNHMSIQRDHLRGVLNREERVGDELKAIARRAAARAEKKPAPNPAS